MKYLDDRVQDFMDMTSYPLDSYLSDYQNFLNTSVSFIVSWYSGQSEVCPSNSFNELKRLKKESESILSLFDLNKKMFFTADWWDLYDLIQTLSVRLDTINIYNKYIRSSITNNSFDSNIEVNYVLRQNQTLESLADEVGYLDSDNDWTNIAMRNAVEEEDYTSDGANRLKIPFQNSVSIDILDVFDSITFDNIYGIDISRKLTFEDNDLKTLSYDDTMSQASEILLSLRKGDNPEYKEDGVATNSVVGNNRNSIQYPTLLRQLSYTFANDDTIKSIKITDIQNKEDNLVLSVDITTKKDDVIQKQTII